ncbi:MAG: DNA gyrase inhibitor YacG [Roseinatronobacter sp.]
MSCPICRKATDATYKPFCSRRCADVDLARWLREDYVIPTPLVPDPDRGDIDPKNDDA